MPQTAAIARTPQRTRFTSTMNGRGPHAWDHHWLVVPLYDQAGQIVGRIWADDPADRLLPSPSRLQALRVFANQAMMAVIAAGHVEQLRAQADRDSLTGMLNRRAFMRELGTEIERSCATAGASCSGRCATSTSSSGSTTPTATRGRPRARGRRGPAGRTIRASDFAFRIGGDEFALLLPETDAAEAHGGGRADRGSLAGSVLGHGPGHQLRPRRFFPATARRPRSSSAAPTRRSTRPSAPTTTCHFAPRAA